MAAFCVNGINIDISKHRANQLLKSKDEALKLRGWDGFCEAHNLTFLGLTKWEHKKIQLEELYEQLHADEVHVEGADVMIPNNNIERLVVFNKMRELINVKDGFIWKMGIRII